MADKKLVGVKVPVDLHERIKRCADAKGISISELVRGAIKQRLNGDKQPVNPAFNEVKKAQTALLEQLSRKDGQFEKLLSELTESRQRTDTIIMQLSKTIEKQQSQLHSQTLLIEDLRQPKPFWHRFFQRRKLLKSGC